MGVEKPQPDIIGIRGLKASCIIGVNADERCRKQTVLVDMTLDVNFYKACASDALEHTVDYHQLEIKAKAFIENSRFFLIEKLADGLARLCLAEALVDKVTVHIEKPEAPVAAKSIWIQITRQRRDYE